MRTASAAFILAAMLGVGPPARATDLPAAYAEAIASRDFGRLLAEINKQFDIPPWPQTRPDVVYPKIAGEAGAEGTVKLVVYIDEFGYVREALVVDSPGWLALEEAARRAAFTIRYEPAKRDEEPVPAWYVADIIFDIEEPGR
jgi:TonB family protein